VHLGVGHHLVDGLDRGPPEVLLGVEDQTTTNYNL
jgi:hypothetical protein